MIDTNEGINCVGECGNEDGTVRIFVTCKEFCN